ncbi:MAG: 30S ribosomal protein S2 [Kiritimatiellaeota bacterium]|nr:30S ribosomal protein S2 [Kiritimatiellota bacterium]
MSDTTLTIQDLLDAGLHFGHQTKRWNPKMKRFIHGAKGGIYIIDLQKTLVHLKIAQEFLNDTVMNGRKVLFVGTKKQARAIFQDAAEQAHQPYVIHRWLGGMLTNNQTVRLSVKRMEELQAFFDDEAQLKEISKKEQSMLRRELTKLERNLTGIKDMTSLPGALFVVDINREKLAIAEAQRLNIPVVALVDTNTDPDLVDYPIPGNDDSIRSLSLIANTLGGTIAEAYDTCAKAKAAEDKRRREEEAVAKAVADKARAEREEKEKEEKKKRAEVLKKLKTEKAKEDKAKKAAEKKVAEKAAFKAKEEADKAAAEKAASEVKEETPAAAEAEAPAEEVKAEEPAAAEEPKTEKAAPVEAAAADVSTEAEAKAEEVVTEEAPATAEVEEAPADEEKKED